MVLNGIEVIHLLKEATISISLFPTFYSTAA